MEILMNLLLMLGGVAVFMFGMKQMSSGREHAADQKNHLKSTKTDAFNYGIGSELPHLSNHLRQLLS